MFYFFFFQTSLQRPNITTTWKKEEDISASFQQHQFESDVQFIYFLRLTAIWQNMIHTIIDFMKGPSCGSWYISYFSFLKTALHKRFKSLARSNRFVLFVHGFRKTDCPRLNIRELIWQSHI